EDYPAVAQNSGEKMQAYLQAHTADTAAFYVGCPGQSVASIRNAIQVRQEIELFLDAEQTAGKLNGLSASAIHHRISDSIAQNPRVRPVRSPVTLDQQKTRAIWNLVLFLVIAVPVVLILLPLLLVYVIWLRWVE